MTKEQATERIKARFDKWALDNEDMKAIQTLIPELRENEDERIRKALIEGVRQIRCKNGITQEQMVAYLEKQKETGIQWFKSDNVKNPDKPYIDKAGMFYTTDGRMCYASEIEKQKEQKPVHTAKEMWKEMRLETYAQASGNRHEPNYSDDSTKMFSLCDIDEIFEKIDNSIVGYSPQMMYPKKYV